MYRILKAAVLFCMGIMVFLGSLFLSPAVLGQNYSWETMIGKVQVAPENTKGLFSDQADSETLYRGIPALLKQSPGGLRLWGEGYYDKSKIAPKDFEEMKSDQTGFLVGIDCKRTQSALIGFYYQYADTDLDWNSLSVEGKETSHLFGGSYQLMFPICHFLVKGNYGKDRYKFMNPAFDSYSIDGYQVNVYSEFGVDFPMGKFGIKPYWGLHYHLLDHDSADFDPSTPGNEWGCENFNGLNNLLGLRLNLLLGSFLTIQGRASWVHEYLDESPTSVCYFGSTPGQTTSLRWNVQGSTARDWGWFGAGLKFSFGTHLKVFADYDLNTNARQTSQTGSLCVCLGW